MSRPFPALRDDLSSMRRRLAQVEGEQKSLESRRAALERDVGLAKGRLALKPRADAFLEELQAEAHHKRVGDFERLLTALVSEVLPGEYPIGLNLEIERGQPSLEIVSRRGADRAEDIYDDQGGALTNVVSMGLRMIAVVRSRTCRFLVLDESDCWIRNDRVRAFYKVVKEAAGKVGVQCLVISHHDVTTFDDGIAVARISGNKDAGVVVENAPRQHHWREEDEGIRYIRLRNFQTYVDEVLYLTPGVNAVTGPNNLGKSSFVRALRSVFYAGEARDSLIRHGERSCTVEIGFGGGRILQWNRQRRRNPVNLWKLLGSDGAVIEENGMRYETGGRTPPDWVTDLFAIGPIEGLDVHISKQKEPIFLLDKPGSTRASVLSVGQESSHIRAMIALHKERSREDADKVKDGEREMASLVRRLECLSRLAPLRERLESASLLLESAEIRHAKSERVAKCVDLIETAHARRRLSSSRLDALSPLPDRTALDAIASQASRARQVAVVSDRMETLALVIDRSERVGKALSPLPKSTPDILRSERLVKLVAVMEESSSSAARSRALEDTLTSLPVVMPTIIRSDHLIHAGSDIKRKAMRSEAVAAQGEIIADLPTAMPQLKDSSTILDVVSKIAGHRGECNRIALEGGRLVSEASACESELQHLTEAMGHSCPVCGGRIDDPHVLVGHHRSHGMENMDAGHA